jgi:hypothetical protein
VAPTQLRCTCECCELLILEVQWHLSNLWGCQAALLLLLLLQELGPLLLLLLGLQVLLQVLRHGLKLCLGKGLHLGL